MPRLLWGLLPLATIDVVLFVVPMVIMALFSLRFSEELLDEPLHFLTFTAPPLSFLLFTVFSEILVFVSLYIPSAVLAICASLEKMPRSLVLAAMALGAPPAQAFLRVVLPQTLPGVYASIVFVFIPILGEYVTPTLVGGMSGVLITNLLVNQIHALEFGFGAAIAFVIATFVLVLLLGLRRSVDLERLYVG